MIIAERLNFNSSNHFEGLPVAVCQIDNVEYTLNNNIRICNDDS
jgi:hypothetical protein